MELTRQDTTLSEPQERVPTVRQGPIPTRGLHYARHAVTGNGAAKRPPHVLTVSQGSTVLPRPADVLTVLVELTRVQTVRPPAALAIQASTLPPAVRLALAVPKVVILSYPESRVSIALPGSTHRSTAQPPAAVAIEESTAPKDRMDVPTAPPTNTALKKPHHVTVWLTTLTPVQPTPLTAISLTTCVTTFTRVPLMTRMKKRRVLSVQAAVATPYASILRPHCPRKTTNTSCVTSARLERLLLATTPRFKFAATAHLFLTTRRSALIPPPFPPVPLTPSSKIPATIFSGVNGTT